MKHMKKLLSLLLVLCLVLSLSCTAFAAGAEKPLDGKTVICTRTTCTVRSICTRPWQP